MSRSALLGAAFLAPVLVLASVSIGVADGELAKDSAIATFSMKPTDDGNYEVTTVGTRFETDFVPATLGPKAGQQDDLLYRLLMIEETHVNKESPEIDGERISGTVKVTAYPLDKSGKGAPLYTIEADGDESRVDGPFVTITRYGCCVSLATHAVYSVESGKYLFNATGMGDSGQWATMGSKKFERILAYHTAETEEDDVVLKGAPNAAIVISYASRTEPLQRVLVTVPKAVIGSDDLINWVPKLEISSKAQPKPSDHIYFDKADESADAPQIFSGVTLRLTLDEKSKIIIPLIGDRLKLDEAKLPKGWALVEIQP